MSWAIWLDDHGDGHVVETVDVPVMAVEETPPPWHRYGAECPCQPRVLSVDPVTGHRTIGHQDPVQ